MVFPLGNTVRLITVLRTLPLYLLLWFCFGATPRNDQGLHLAYGMRRIELGLAMCKANALSSVLAVLLSTLKSFSIRGSWALVVVPSQTDAAPLCSPVIPKIPHPCPAAQVLSTLILSSCFYPFALSRVHLNAISPISII